MRDPIRLLISSCLVASSLSLGCAPSVVFPEESSAAVLPLRDPLILPEVSVLATLPGRDGPWPRWMIVDSGASGVSLPLAWAAHLGGQNFDRGEARLQKAEGPVQSVRQGVLPSLALGEYTLRDVPVHLTNDRVQGEYVAILGQSVLAHAPWELDLDRGTLTLGAKPWPDAPDVTVVPLRHLRDVNLDVVTLYVDQHPIEMLLDTGAFVSAIPLDVASRSGLSAYEVDPTSHVRPSGITGDAVLGSMGLGRVTFASSPQMHMGYGLLGLDLLGAYRIQVVPGKRLALRPRGDVWATAPQRIARWPWMRGCQQPGCIRAQLEPEGDDARLTFSFEVDYPHPIEVLLGCHDDESVGSSVLTAAQRLALGLTHNAPHHVIVRVAEVAKDQPLEIVLQRAAGPWFSATGSRCRNLAALDVIPIPLEKAGEHRAIAHLFL